MMTGNFSSEIAEKKHLKKSLCFRAEDYPDLRQLERGAVLLGNN